MWAVLWIACSDATTPDATGTDAPDPPGPTDTDPGTDTPSTTGTPPTDPPFDPGLPAALAMAGPITCPDPSARATAYYDLKVAPGIREDLALLEHGGAVVADFDGDGLQDVFLAKTVPELRIQQPGQVFADEAATWFEGVDPHFDMSHTVGGAAADIDGDGDLDLAVTRFGEPNRLFRNDGARFTDITNTALPPRTCLDETGSTKRCKTQSASFGDVDLDGDLDLAFGNYGDTPDDHLDQGMAPGGADELYLNDGTGFYTDISHLLPASVHDGYNFHLAWWNLDADPEPELWSVHDFGFVRPSQLVDFSGVNFQGSTPALVVSNGLNSAAEDMGIAAGDWNGDGIVDFGTSSWRTYYVRESSAFGYLQILDGRGIVPEWPPPKEQEFGWGTEAGDLDNDMDLDVVCNFGKWSTYEGSALNEDDEVWENQGTHLGANFVPVADQSVWSSINDEQATRGLVLADISGDGWLDVVKGSLHGDTPLYLSNCGEDRFVIVRPRMATGNTHAIGAVVTATVGAISQKRWIGSGNTGLYGSGPAEAHMGWGAADTIDLLEVTWPDGQVSRFEDVPTNHVITVTR